MNDFIKLALTAMIETGGARAEVRRASGTVAYALISVVAGLAVFALSAAALWTFARPYVGAAGASLSVAAVIAVLWFAVFIATRRRSASGTTGLFDRNKSSVLMAALAAGMAAGSAANR